MRRVDTGGLVDAKSLHEALVSDTNVLLYGPPGTGKTHLVQEVATLFDGDDYGNAVYVETDRESAFLQNRRTRRAKVFWVTFHQSYSYDSFVVGLRPDLDSDSPLKLRPEPGVLLQAAAHAAAPGNTSLIIIDEINRGNVSRVFGDFITIMEPDKRLGEDGVPTARTVHVTLPYVSRGSAVDVELVGALTKVANPFAMPRRVYTLATMNSIDRSAAPLDAAIRRRFRVVNLPVDLDAIAKVLGLDAASVKIEGAELSSVSGVKTLAAYLLSVLNLRIEWFLGRDFQLGQWYLRPLSDTDKLDEAITTLAGIWSGSIWPQLEESFALRPEQLAALLALDASQMGGVLRMSSTPPDAAMKMGAVAAPSFDTSASATEIVESLNSLAIRLSEES